MKNYIIQYDDGSSIMCTASGFWEAEITARDDEYGMEIVSISIEYAYK